MEIASSCPARRPSSPGLSLLGPHGLTPHLHPYGVGLTPVTPATKWRLHSGHGRRSDAAAADPGSRTGVPSAEEEAYVQRQNRGADSDLIGWPESTLRWRTRRGWPTSTGWLVIAIPCLLFAGDLTDMRLGGNGERHDARGVHPSHESAAVRRVREVNNTDRPRISISNDGIGWTEMPADDALPVGYFTASLTVFDGHAVLAISKYDATGAVVAGVHVFVGELR
jgi:hypothetical protein